MKTLPYLLFILMLFATMACQPTHHNHPVQEHSHNDSNSLCCNEFIFGIEKPLDSLMPLKSACFRKAATAWYWRNLVNEYWAGEGTSDATSCRLFNEAVEALDNANAACRNACGILSCPSGSSTPKRCSMSIQ